MKTTRQTSKMMAVDEVLQLLRRALDEFEDVPLGASVRRALRIALLLGDAEPAWRFRQELSPVGGSGVVSASEVQSLWPEEEYEEVRRRHRRMVEEYMKERQPAIIPDFLHDSIPPGSILSGSVDELDSYLRLARVEAERAESSTEYGMWQARAGLQEEVLARIRQRTFHYLCRCEVQVASGATSQRVFERHRKRVDRYLGELAPEVLAEFVAAYRRATEGDPPSRAQALTSCRRILEAVADRVYPATATPVQGPDGKERILTQDKYINRLWQFFLEQPEYGTGSEVSLAILADIGGRIDRLYDLTNKGIHAKVTEEEMNLCVIQTYLLAGEALALHAQASASDSEPHDSG
jgi:hypothetical protein